jgi:UDP-N-acetylmuramoyl-L-alanyl-D-glutamate--2,6-diaminopimelate ligase
LLSSDLKALFAGFTDTSDWDETKVSGLCLDSREIENNDLFLAVPGKSTDGRQFISAALVSGAAAVVAEFPAAYSGTGKVYEVQGLKRLIGAIADRFYQSPSKQLCVIGVTGTNGKTTCCHLLAQVLQKLGAQSGVLGTLGNGLVGELHQAELTTSDAVHVHKDLRGLFDKGADFICMEASSHALDQGRVDRVAFDITLFTNLSQDHLDYHGDMQSYGEAKARLFQWPDLTAQVVNIDDPFGAWLAEQSGSGVLWTYGECAAARVQLQKLSVLPDRIELRVTADNTCTEICVALLGSFNAMNVLAVFATLLALGFPAARAAQALSTVQPVRGRMEVVLKPGKARVVVDYAHTPDALSKALQACRAQCSGKLWVIFGCGGDRDSSKRADMGSIACLNADYSIVTSDNPRCENPLAIIADIQAGCDGSEVVLENRQKAIAFAISQASKNDIILVAGKGHETYQIVGKRYLPMDDRLLAEQAMEGIS